MAKHCFLNFTCVCFLDTEVRAKKARALRVKVMQLKKHNPRSEAAGPSRTRQRHRGTKAYLQYEFKHKLYGR